MLYQLSYSRSLLPQAGRSLASAHHPRNAFTSTSGAIGDRGSGGEGDRTPDLVNAIHALSQLSYAPIILARPADPPGCGEHDNLLGCLSLCQAGGRTLLLSEEIERR